MKIRINPQLRELIVPLAPEEKTLLEAAIVADGCRDPLVIWGDVLIDGHHRFEICTRLGLPYKTTNIEFSDIDAAQDWIDKNQLGRRNLTHDQASFIRGRIYNRWKKRRQSFLYEKKKWMANARATFSPGEKQDCVLCGEDRSICHAHHKWPLWRQFGYNHVPDQDSIWLCPNCHAKEHLNDDKL